MHATLPRLIESDFPAIRRAGLEVLQINLGYRCNQACLHCHVNASPYRKEAMSRATAEQVVEFMQARGVGTVDLTGGAPELNAQFRYLVDAAVGAGVHVIDRCNLTVLQEPGQEELGEYLAARGVHVIASLPCYMEENVDAQRGDGVFQRSIEGLRRLNKLGYAGEYGELLLDLVYNPQGPQLPPPQQQLQVDYKKHLREHFGIRFNSLLTLANLPIQRFGSTLISRGQFDVYMSLLKGAHQPANVPGVMCRSLLSIDYQGYVYDCDFNQMLGVPLGGQRRHITDLLATPLEGASIAVADHCYGCTAGQGSSCGGALSG
ncbi:MAG: arsenosugar biosynthesis radical SAM protein ArsS [Gammaproteobacteria bacterium]|nr:arsenosugar biosynthesis radical SAM protein ArsS [Gammaproteobacteria bacterium]